MSLNVNRIDGFDLPIEVRAEHLPPGITSIPAVVDSDEAQRVSSPSRPGSSALFHRTDLAGDHAEAQAKPSWTRSDIPRGSRARTLANRLVDGSRSRRGRTSIPPRSPHVRLEVEIRLGQQVTMTLAVDRSPAFQGRVPIDVKNLPQGVRVLNIGLNGVLITEVQTERTVSLIAEPWARLVV